MELKLCGFPGYGSPGVDGSIGITGSNVHILKTNDNISTTLLDNDKYLINDIFYKDNKMYTIVNKDRDNARISSKEISDYPIVSSFKSLEINELDNKKSVITADKNILLSNTLKTNNDIVNDDASSLLNILSNNRFIDCIDSSGFSYFNIINDNESTYDIKINDDVSLKTCASNLYVNYDSNFGNNKILSEAFGFEDLQNVINTTKIVDNELHIGRPSLIGDIRFTKILYDASLKSFIKEIVIKDYEDDQYEYDLTDKDESKDTIIIYRIYYRTLCDVMNNIYYVIHADVNLEISKSELLYVDSITNIINWSKNSKKIIIGEKIITNTDTPDINDEINTIDDVIIDDDIIEDATDKWRIINVKLYFSKDCDYTLYTDLDELADITLTELDESSDLDRVCYTLTINPQHDETFSYKLNIGKITYELYYEKIKASFDDSVKYIFENITTVETSNLTNGVPVNGYLQIYRLTFLNNSNIFIKDGSSNISINVTDGTNYYNGIAAIFQEDILSLLNKKSSNETVKPLLGVMNSFEFDGKHKCKIKDGSGLLDVSDVLCSNYLTDDNDFYIDSSVALAIPDQYLLYVYFDYAEPKYGNLVVDITCNIAGVVRTKKSNTLVIPWDLTTFKPHKMNSRTEFNLRVGSELRRPYGICPVEMTNISIESTWLNTEKIVNPTLNEYNYIYSDLSNESIIDDRFKSTAILKPIYSFGAHLMIGYNCPDNNTSITLRVSSDLTDTYIIKNKQYAQIKRSNPSPIWVGVAANYKTSEYILDNDMYVYGGGYYIYAGHDTDSYVNDYLLTPGGSDYTPSILLVDSLASTKHEYNNWNDHLKNNTFLGFVEWNVHTINVVPEVNDKYHYQTRKYKFVNVDDSSIDNKSETMYGLYFNISPKLVKSTPEEPTFDFAVNILKRPTIYVPNSKEPQYSWCNTDSICKDVFDASYYYITYSVNNNSDVNNNNNSNNGSSGTGSGSGGSKFELPYYYNDELFDDRDNNNKEVFRRETIMR